MSITNLLRLIFNRGKYGILFTISGFVYIRFSHFHHFGTLKRALLTCPYQFYLVSLIQSSIEHSFIVFGFVYISSHICSHIGKLKNNVITELLHKAFRKYIQLLYLDQVPSHKQALKICWIQKSPNLDQKGPKMGRGKIFPDCKPQFSKRRP